MAEILLCVKNFRDCVYYYSVERITLPEKFTVTRKKAPISFDVRWIVSYIIIILVINMTEIERLAKNNRIRENGKETREKRKSQACRVYRVKIDISHLNEAQREHLKMLFVEAKWDALTFMKDHDTSGCYTKVVTVHSLGKDKNPVLRPSVLRPSVLRPSVLRPSVLRPSVTHDLQYISSQMKQSVISGIKSSLKALSSLKKNNHKVGGLRYKSDYMSINLQQHKITYRFNDDKNIGIQGFSKSLKIRGAKQFWNIPNLEFANAKLLNLPDGYYLAITIYQNKGGEKKKISPKSG